MDMTPPAKKNKQLMIRVSEEDLETWRAAAEAEREELGVDTYTVTDWIRRRLREAVTPTKPKKR